MKISEIFKLNKTQYELDFVDVDIDKDTPLFLDPFFISTRTDPWSIDTSRTIRSFFQQAIDLVSLNKIDEAKKIFNNLNEINELCLGLSTGKPRGKGMGSNNTNQVFESILSSNAIQTGLVEDIQDTAIFIDGIGKDKVSDATANIIKERLIDYTISQCNLWNIPLTDNVASGLYWNPQRKRWDQKMTQRLIIDDKPILLVPKISVTFFKEYVDRKYFQHYMLNFLQDEHLFNNSSLVQQKKLKSGEIKKFVTKKDVEEFDTPFSKAALREFTERHPIIFENFKKDKRVAASPTRNEDIADEDISTVVDHLIKELKLIKPGSADAGTYHNIIIGILEFIFFPYLTNPIKEKEINDGRKRIDITFDNSAKSGFFFDLHEIHKIISRYIFVECKNYSDDIENPQLDQLAMRFSPNTGKFGILVCRSIRDEELIKKRCIDIWKQKNELVIVLTDKDIFEYLNLLKVNRKFVSEKLKQKQREIILS